MTEPEKQLAQAIEKLREDLPTNFIVLYEKPGGETQIVASCNLQSARELLTFGIEVISEQYAYKRATEKVEGVGG